MTARKRQLRDRVWELVETSINGYSNLIDTLLTECSEDQIISVIEKIRDPLTCVRCRSDLKNGHCSDKNCPFSRCEQSDMKGWDGYPTDKERS